MRYFYFVPGIYDLLDNAKDWDFQAQAWIVNNWYGVAAGFNNANGMVGAVIARAAQAAQVSKDLNRISASKSFASIVPVGHSNGCGIILEALADYAGMPLDLRLAAAAVNKDCNVNGLNVAVAAGKINTARLYVSPNDEILSLPVVSYGRLGLDGPVNQSRELCNVTEIVKAYCLHSDWVSKDFQRTMQDIVR